jgi:apolipoprotein N-acyltransferase
VQRRTIRNVILALASSLLLIAAWPPSNLNFLLFFAFVPILILVHEQKKSRNAFLWFYFSFDFFLILLHSTLLIERDYFFPLVIGLIFIPILWSIPILFTHIIARRYGFEASLFLTPFLYLSQEISQYYWDFGMTYFNMGVGLSNSPLLLGIYPYLGQEGGTLLILGFNCSLVFLYKKFKEGKIKIYHISPIVVFILVICSSYVLAPTLSKTGALNVAIFQPDKKVVDALKNNLSAQVDLLEAELKKKKKSKIDLVICPESYFFDMAKFPLFVNTLKNHEAIKRLMSLSIKYNVSIFSGAILVQLYRAKEPPTPSAKTRTNKPGEYFDIYNGSLFITPDEKVEWRTKQNLVPFSESIPFYKFFNYLEKKGLWPTRFDQTYGVVPFQGPFKFGKVSIAPAICFESVFPIVMDSYIQNEANLVVVLSTNWTTSQRVLDQQQDAMPIIQRSFGKTLVYATLDQQSSITDYKGQRAFSDSTFEVKQINLYDTSAVYSKFASKPWIWLIISLGLTLIVMLIIKNKNIL